MATTDKTTTTTGLDRNADPVTDAPGSHPTGAGIGAASGAATGAALGALGGPIGIVIGAIAGGISGGYVGKGIGEAVDPTEDWSKHDKDYWKSSHAKQSYAASHEGKYEYDTDVEPAYKYGSAAASVYSSVDDDVPSTGAGTDTAATGSAGLTRREFADVEPDLRSNWEKARGTSKMSYEEARPAIAASYDRAMNRNLELHEERLNVSKDRVQTGEVSLRKETVTETRTMEVPVEREEVVVSVRRGDGSTGGTITDDETIRVPVSEERVHVTKDVVKTGEVEINKKVVQGTERVADSIRKEKVRVERDGRDVTDEIVEDDAAASR